MNIINVMLWMKRNAYEDSTVKKVAREPESLFLAPKTQKPTNKKRKATVKQKHLR
jgi:hypothetical protein